jgi:hypothetical protein
MLEIKASHRSPAQLLMFYIGLLIVYIHLLKQTFIWLSTTEQKEHDCSQYSISLSLPVNIEACISTPSITQRLQVRNEEVVDSEQCQRAARAIQGTKA